ncbi:MAG: DUF389 domain-containing protein [Cyanobacteria bacterium SZAS LIN-3]|nr:DUF389 domain-containing protein [Cyanobacteria bacterium SZAS LIN-3]
MHDRLEVNGKVSSDFLAFLAGATVIATLGLFQNSPAVIIGAMIIAPLMRPLACLSLATITADTRLLLQAVVTLLVGTALGVIVAAAMAICLRSLELTPEIVGRTHPTLLDLGVALAAGAIGAYCQTDEKLSNTMAGVAIAVALVPPLSVVGIGLAFNSMSIAAGAGLLYATNLVGITIAGALVFLLKGYSPLALARRGLLISAACMIVLILPLGFSMRELVLENVISARIRSILKEKTMTFRGVQLRELKVLRFKKTMSVHATVVGSDEPITPHQVKLVQDLLAKDIGAAIDFRLRIIPAREITALELSPEGETKIVSPMLESPGMEHTLVQPELDGSGEKLELEPTVQNSASTSTTSSTSSDSSPPGPDQK